MEISEGGPLRPEIEAQQQIREIFSVLASLTRDMDSVKHTLEQVDANALTMFDKTTRKLKQLKLLRSIVKQMIPSTSCWTSNIQTSKHLQLKAPE